VDRDGRVAAVRCRAAPDLGVEAVYVGVAPGYKLENVHVDRSAGAETATDAEATLDERRGSRRKGEEEGGGGASFGGGEEGVLRPPVYVGVEDGYVYVKRTAPMDQRQFRRYLKTCRGLGFRFDKGSSRWRS
jgi:hypothetical protein